MSLLHRRIATFALLALFLVGSAMTVVPLAAQWDSSVAHDATQQSTVADSTNNLTVPYVDRHYGAADGIIDPFEYAADFTDPVTGITAYLEHNGTTLFLGLSAPTSGWIAVGWQNYTDSFTVAGLNQSDLLFGYAPGTPSEDYWRARDSDAGTVHYILTSRNGSLLQEGDFPTDEMNDPFSALPALDMYRNMVLAGGGMRLGEVRHFIIPAEEAYSADPSHQLYGFDLEYETTLTRLKRGASVLTSNTSNPARLSQVVFSERRGIGTLQHLPDNDQTRVLSANASDDGETTQLEYVLQMISEDSEDISILNVTDKAYPFVFLYGNTEDFGELPVQHTFWSSPVMMQFEPNTAPTLLIESPTSVDPLVWVDEFKVNATDNTFVRKVEYRVDNEDWTEMEYDFISGLWEYRLDLSEYAEGPHTVWFSGTDPSNTTGVTFVNVTISRPYTPYLGMELSVTRAYRTEAYHTALVDDQYTIRNNGSAAIGALEVFLPLEYASNFLSLTAEDSQGNEIEVTKLQNLGGMMHWRLHFYEPVDYGQTYIFTTNMRVHAFDILTDLINKEYDLKFLKFPVLPYPIDSASFRLVLRTGDSLSPNFLSPDTTMENLAPFTIEKFETAFRSFSPFIVADRTTTVTVDPWGWLSYRETISLHNIGPPDTPEDKVSFILPAYSTGTRIFDRVGILAKSQLSLSGEWNVSREVEIDLLGDRFGEQLLPGYSYKFNIDYLVPISEFEQLIEGANLLKIPLGSLQGIVAISHTIDLVLPYSVDTLQAYGSYRLLFGVFDTTLRYQMANTSEYNPTAVQILYRTSPIVLVRPLAFALIMGLIALAYVAFKGVDTGVRPEDLEDDELPTADKRQVGAPPILLRDFANLYSKKTALSMDLEKLEAARRRGKVKKREFMIRERDIKSQLEQIDSQLPSLKNDLGGYGTRYRDMISQIELHNERIEGAKAGLRQLLLRKKKQRISRVAFERSRQDYLKTIQKATTAIDRILLSIQEEAGEI
ncbi:MAG: hypothetical protein ACFFD9_02450 [Candidatus Thorarchaeota archaeon]